MKKTIAVAALFALATAGAAVAREGKGKAEAHRGKGREGRVHGGARAEERMAQRLELNEAQRAQFRAIKEREKRESKALRAEIKAKHELYKDLKKADDPRAESVRAEMESLADQLKMRRRAAHDEMLAMLTPEQRAKADDMRRAMVDKRDRDRSAKR